MLPSSSRIGRRRSGHKENNAEVKSDSGRKTLNSDCGSYIQQRSMSSPNVANCNNLGTSTMNGTCNAPSACCQAVTTSNNLHPNERSDDSTLSTGVHSERYRSRRRSGSWTGVNESDDDLEHIHTTRPVENNDGASNSLENSVNSSSYPEYPYFQSNSYQHSAGSCTSENTVPHDYRCINEETVKRRLKFFFMNPVEKWQAKKRFPWKLLVQIIKIVICTIQLCMFASQRYNHVTYLWDTKVSFSHLFVKGWDTTREVNAYPPSNGPLAIYEIKNFYQFLDYAIVRFSEVEKTAVGAYKYDRNEGQVSMPSLCFSQYLVKTSGADNHSQIISGEIEESCFAIPSSILNHTYMWSTEEFLASNNISINFDVLLDVSYSFSLKTLKLKADIPFDTPECYNLETLIYFDNHDHDGQMLVDLEIAAKVIDCSESIGENKQINLLRSIFNLLTIVICSLSFVMCLRAIFRALKLRNIVNDCFMLRFHREMDSWEKFEFVNLWYVLICVNDLLIIIGSIIKMGLESQDYEGYLDKWNICSLLLGTGNLFIWFGCLRYLGFFETYNVLILTIKSCFPNVLRYSICIMMVFAGYSLCGWLVLGPYHIKFRSLSTTSECLYSLINGDDMFATFSSTIDKDAIVWWFSRIYLYTFISLFIYVILSLFIAIITDAYDTIKRYYEEGFPMSTLMKFANECQADPWNGDFHDGERTIQDLVNHICCCCPSLRIRRNTSASGYEPIST